MALSRLIFLAAQARALGLPGRGWAWLGPWLIDSEAFGSDRVVGNPASPTGDPDDFTGAGSDGAAGAGGAGAGQVAPVGPEGWLYGGVDWPRGDVGWVPQRVRVRAPGAAGGGCAPVLGAAVLRRGAKARDSIGYSWGSERAAVVAGP